MDLKDSLNTRFNIAIQSSSELEFYQSIYSYFDYIHKTPELLAIFEESENDYTQKHRNFWRKHPMTDEEADEAAAQTTKLEGFNLFAIGATMYVRIYLPIDDYKKTEEPDSQQDPVAVILMRGVKYAESLNKFDNKSPIKKWSKKSLEGYARWFNGRRGYYERELRKFHLMFLDELSKLKPQIGINFEVKFDTKESILTIEDKQVKIKLKNDKPVDHYILEYIFNNKEGLKTKSYYSDILEDKFSDEDKNERTLRRGCESINNKVSKQANISNFLIFESGKTGSVQINPVYL